MKNNGVKFLFCFAVISVVVSVIVSVVVSVVVFARDCLIGQTNTANLVSTADLSYVQALYDRALYDRATSTLQSLQSAAALQSGQTF